MEKLLIIDSESLMKRAFYAIPNMSNEESLYTNAIYGFTKMLFHIKKKIQPNLMVSVLNSIWENIPKVLCEQKPYIKEILENASVVIYEEDDIDVSKTIISLVNDGRKKSMEIYIATADKTLLQLIDDNVKVIYVESGINSFNTYDKEKFIEAYGIEPIQYSDVLALMDSNYLGEKTALSLIKTYGSLEGIIENSEKINSSRIRKVIEENKESVLLNKKLISVNGKEGITLVNDSKDYNEEELTRIFKELNLSSLLEVLGIENIDDIASDEEEIKVIDKLDDFKCFIKTIKERIYITYETSNSNVYSKIRVENMYICNGDESVKIDLSSLYEENISETNLMLKEFMENDDIKKVIHDGKNLIKALSKEGTQVNGFDFDSAIAAYLIDSARD